MRAFIHTCLTKQNISFLWQISARTTKKIKSKSLRSVGSLKRFAKIQPAAAVRTNLSEARERPSGTQWSGELVVIGRTVIIALVVTNQLKLI